MNYSNKTHLLFFLPTTFVVVRATVIAMTVVMLLTCINGGMADDKRGTAGAQSPRENAINARWAYNYMNEPTTFDVGAANFEFVPMIFRATTISGVNDQIDRILSIEENFGTEVQFVLGFNEPERAAQANMSVATALNIWQVITDRFEGTGIKLVSPAVSGGQGINEWLVPFMDEVERRNADSDPNNNLQVDAIAIHIYSVSGNGVGQANNVLNTIDRLFNDYGRPIWLTEFAGVDFSGNTPVAEKRAFNEVFLDTVIPGLESRAHVERYGWWQFNIAGNAYSPLSTTSNGIFTPTSLGHRYQGSLMTGDVYNFNAGTRQPTDVHYLLGGTLTNTGPALDTALRAIDAIEGDSTFTGSSDYGFEVADNTFMRIRDGATLRKQGNNTVTLPGVPIFNDGTLLIQNGAMRLADGSELTGQGNLRVDSASTLVTSGDDVSLDSQSIALNQSSLHVEDGLTTLSGELDLSGTNEVRTDGNLVISGVTTGTGSILSTGLGTLFLNSAGSHSSGTQVSDGSLIVANPDSSATGSGAVLVTGTGLFGGSGQVDGAVFANGNATVAPGVAQTASGSTSPPPSINEGVVVDAIDFDFTGIQDDAPLTQTSNLNDALQVVSGLDFGSGLNPRNAANAGNEFNVAGFTTLQSFDAANAVDDYLAFTVAPVEGLAIQLQDASFEVRRNGDAAPTQFRMFNSITGFNGFADGRFFSSSDTSRTTFTANFTNTAPTADPVEIRLYGWASTSEFGNLRVTSVSLDASFSSDPNSIAFDPTGILELGGNYSQSSFATLEIDLGGTQAGEFDQLQVEGNVALSGTLDVAMIDGFEPANGQTFEIITANNVTGTFDEVIAPDGMNVQVNYSNSTVSLTIGGGMIGDFDGDNDVDIADINFYRFAIGLDANGEFAQFDLDGDGQVTAADMQIHVETYVQTSNGQTGTFLGDVNLDGTVNVLGDAITVVLNLGNSVTSYDQGDVNLDGTVNVLGDAISIILNLNRTNNP